jgi:hypothetical protein
MRKERLMAKVWHVVIGGKQYGPLSDSDLKALAQSGRLNHGVHMPLLWAGVHREWNDPPWPTPLSAL